MADAPRREINASRARLERLLLENILPFWTERVVDRERGGYRLNHDITGRYRGRAPKRLIAQARVLWFFARIGRSPYAAEEHRRIAHHGFEFLRERMWDHRYGGFYWEVDRRFGLTASAKYLNAQSFALFAVSEYAARSGRLEARALAEASFAVLEERFHDREHPGYHEHFRRRWSLPRPHPSRSGLPPQLKTVNSHIHVLEALATHWTLTRNPLCERRLRELVEILTRHAVRPDGASLAVTHTRDWRAVEPSDLSTSYGHDIELVWLVISALEQLGEPLGPYLPRLRRIADHCLTHGWDAQRGGLYNEGPAHGPAHDLTKLWWVQAEALVACLMLYRSSGEALYAERYLALLDWIERNQVDWEQGEWYARVETDGRVEGDKASAWKSPYHNGRAMLECLRLLEEPA